VNAKGQLAEAAMSHPVTDDRLVFGRQVGVFKVWNVTEGLTDIEDVLKKVTCACVMHR